MTQGLSITKAITDSTLDPTTRAEALAHLGEAPTEGNVLGLLKTQLEKELESEDHRFVIYLLGAIRRIYDRNVVTILIELLQRPMDISLRSQCVLGLRELYRHSLTHSSAGRREMIRRQVPQAGVIDEHFVIHGTALDDSDRKQIEQTLRAIAESDHEIGLLREEAGESYQACRQLALSLK